MEENLAQPPTDPGSHPKGQPGDRKRDLTVPLLVIAIVAALVLIGVIAVQRLSTPQRSALQPTQTAASESAPPTSPSQPQPPTPTATQVLAETTASSTPQAPAPETALVAEEVGEPVVGERVRNGDFEKGFKDQQVGLGWTPFNNGSAIFEFIDETWLPAVLDGEHAQRIQVREASQPDRYAGIYQTVQVVPRQAYNLSLHGQIRTGQGDIQISQYGYRMQLGIDYQGGQDWSAIDNWIELPWDEQRFDSEFLFFYDYETSVVPTGAYLTLFIRTWNKWPDPGRVEYTLDAISLMGPIPSEEIAFDQPLPTTGDAPLDIDGWLRMVASMLVLCLLVAGAVWQIRRQVN